MSKLHETLKKVFESKIFARFLYCVGIAVLVCAIFTAGVVVGFHKASFGRAWGEHYMDNFGMGHMDHLGLNQHFPNAHGAIGKIIKIELPTIIVEDKDNTEKIVAITDDTKIQNGTTLVKATDLILNNFVVVIGTPDTQGQIEAKFIRMVPAPEAFIKK